MVIHLPNDEHPVDNLGLERLGIIIKEAEKYDIKVAFENLSIQEFLDIAYQRAKKIDDMREA